MDMDDDDTTGNHGGNGLGLVAAACVLALGLGAGGYFLAQGLDKTLQTLRAPRIVSVKGLAERPVHADRALWPLRFVATGNDLAAVQTQIESQQKAVMDFLKNQGLADGDVEQGRIEVMDRLANPYNNAGEASQTPRFIVYGTVTVRSANIDAVRASSRQIGDVIRQGVVFTSEGIGGGAPASLMPYYLFTRLNDVKADMLAEATRNARAAAQQFAEAASVPLGNMVRASQGVFTILPGDTIPGASEETQIDKTLRVVSSVDYALGQ